MANHIATANLNIVNGLLVGSMTFRPGLNILSGENGTLKTRVLQALRSGSAVPSVTNQPLRMQAISPKRNSERRAAEGILQFFRQQNRTWEITLNERLNREINDATFDNYPSLGDLFYLVFEHRCKDGGDRQQHMRRLIDDLNRVIQSVFPRYALVARWDLQLGAPRISMRKGANVEFPIESLSLGEQEVLSLVASIDAAKDNIDVYLIDEPEVHLNWHLEERLFAFLDDLCEEHDKQAIVVTHSRTIFKPRFLPKAQFLYWAEDGKVQWSHELAADQKRRLAGDAIEIIALGEFTKPTFFVEDGAHTQFLRALAELFDIEISTSECGNAANVKSLFRYRKTHGGWANSLFMIDGDNQGNPLPGESQFIHLPVYCVENILLDPDLLATATRRTVDEVKSMIVQVIYAARGEIFRKNKFFEFLVDQIREAHITYDRLSTFDGSLIFPHLADRLAISQIDLTAAYLRAARDQGQLERLLPPALLGVLIAAAQGVAPDASTPSPRSTERVGAPIQRPVP
jgi:hypothetical protein